MTNLDSTRRIGRLEHAKGLTVHFQARTLTTLAGVAFVISAIIGFALSLAYGLVEGWDQALGPHWSLTLVFLLAAWLARRPDRWGLAGTIIALVVSVSYLAYGQPSDPITSWAYRNNFGFAVYISAALVAASAAVIATAFEVWVRARNRGWLPDQTGRP